LSRKYPWPGCLLQRACAKQRGAGGAHADPKACMYVHTAHVHCLLSHCVYAFSLVEQAAVLVLHSWHEQQRAAGLRGQAVNYEPFHLATANGPHLQNLHPCSTVLNKDNCGHGTPVLRTDLCKHPAASWSASLTCACCCCSCSRLSNVNIVSCHGLH
jgi:hypothetical protein